MKRFALLSLLALASACVHQQSASAWTNFKFSVGMNVQWSSGNNCLLWGLWKDGPASNPSVFYNQGGYGGYGGYGYAPPVYPGYHGGCSANGCPAPAAIPNTKSKKTDTAPGQLPPSVTQAYYQNWIAGYGYQPVAYYYPTHYPLSPYYCGFYNSIPQYWYAR